MEIELQKQSYRLPNNLFAMGPIIFELWVMETENWVIKKGNPNGPLVIAASILNLNRNIPFYFNGYPMMIGIGFEDLDGGRSSLKIFTYKISGLLLLSCLE